MKKNYAFLLGSFIFLLVVSVDAAMFINGMKALAIFSFMSSLLVFAAAMVWLIYRDDAKIYFRNSLLIIPLIAFGASISQVMKQVPMELRYTPENLDEVGNLLMSRYQIGLWIVAMTIFFIFIMASSLMSGERK